MTVSSLLVVVLCDWCSGRWTGGDSQLLTPLYLLERGVIVVVVDDVIVVAHHACH